jgi:DNA modification methylase
LVVTSPPYWTLKEYPANENQLGLVRDYEKFHDELAKVWGHCHRVLVPGGRVVCVVGDVCIARRRNKGRHMVMPLHADISVRARRVGFDYLTPILWHKIANANYEVENGSSFLGKPYEPNAILKNDMEYILMLRKPGGYRKPTSEQRKASMLAKDEHAKWFRFLVRHNGRIYPAPSGTIPGGVGVPPSPHVLIRWRYGPRSLHGDCLHRYSGLPLRQKQHRRGNRPALLPPSQGPRTGRGCHADRFPARYRRGMKRPT